MNHSSSPLIHSYILFGTKEALRIMGRSRAPGIQPKRSECHVSDEEDGALVLSRRVPFPAATGHIKQRETREWRQIKGNG